MLGAGRPKLTQHSLKGSVPKPLRMLPGSTSLRPGSTLHATSVAPKSTRTRRESTPPATCARRDSTRPRPASTPGVTRASPESTRPLRVTVNIDCDNCVATQLSHARLTPADALDLLASQLSHAVAPASALYLPRSRSRWRRKWHPQQQRTCQPVFNQGAPERQSLQLRCTLGLDPA